MTISFVNYLLRFEIYGPEFFKVGNYSLKLGLKYGERIKRKALNSFATKYG